MGTRTQTFNKFSPRLSVQSPSSAAPPKTRKKHISLRHRLRPPTSTIPGQCAHTMSRVISKIPRHYVVPAELTSPGAIARLPTHELFTRLGFFSHPKPGLVHWTPIGLAMLDKVQSLVHRAMHRAGSEQVRLSSLSPAALWEKTGRWGGTELFKLKDSAGADYCLAPTCEEEITALVRSQVASYKSLPLSYYQITNKYRDEKRPRSGLLRGREFLMKDAYTFDVSPEAAMESYDAMVEAYHQLFQALRVPYVQAAADSGDIGGNMSHEWHYVHGSGEDTLFTCAGCGATSNVEKTLSYPAQEPEGAAPVAVSYLTTTDRKTLVCAYYPSERTFQPQFVKEEIPDVDLSGQLAQEEVLALFSDEDTLISKKIVRIMDSRLHSRSDFPDFPIAFINRSLITTLTDIPLVSAREGEICHVCEDGELATSRAIEVGHTFFLGDRYTKALDFYVEVPAPSGELVKKPVMMGCYGIGVSRIIAAIGEINRDDHGFRWPAVIAPWHATVVDAADNMDAQSQVAHQLQQHGVDFKIDDRAKVRMGRKIRDSNTFGIPLAIIVGKKFPMVEIEVRGIAYGDSWRQHARAEHWTVENGKHTVHVDRLGEAAAALLADM